VATRKALGERDLSLDKKKIRETRRRGLHERVTIPSPKGNFNLVKSQGKKHRAE